MDKSFFDKFIELQSSVKVSKDQYNEFGRYAYWTVGDIMAVARPKANSLGLYITMSDSIQRIENRFYVTSTVTISDGLAQITNSASARESDDKKGMDQAQITGSASSYARKYALAGILGLDGEKDADATNMHDKEPPRQSDQKSEFSSFSNENYKHTGGAEFPMTDKQRDLIIKLCKEKGVEVPKNKLSNAKAREMIDSLLKSK